VQLGNPTDVEIERAARAFRAAIDAAGPEPWESRGQTFPRGACGLTSELLGRYLIDELGIVAKYVCEDAGDIGGWQGSHAWLEFKGLTIDITGDQFGWEPVIVTRAPEYHGRGHKNVRHKGLGLSSGRSLILTISAPSVAIQRK
jgi:hypothetical protein